MLKVLGNGTVQDEVDGHSLLDEIAREGARRMLLAALESEVTAYLEAHHNERDEDGHALVVRNGKGRTRKVAVGPEATQSLAVGADGEEASSVECDAGWPTKDQPLNHARNSTSACHRSRSVRAI
jgi:hypothetical protein